MVYTVGSFYPDPCSKELACLLGQVVIDQSWTKPLRRLWPGNATVIMLRNESHVFLALWMIRCCSLALCQNAGSGKVNALTSTSPLLRWTPGGHNDDYEYELRRCSRMYCTPQRKSKTRKQNLISPGRSLSLTGTWLPQWKMSPTSTCAWGDILASMHQRLVWY